MYSTNDGTFNDDLITRHAPLVKRIAYHMIGRLPPSVIVDDLIQAGMLGLLNAVSHYDEKQGASFETYATIRIRGAMLDELRRNDWAPKSVHRKAREVTAATLTVEAETGRDATEREIVAVMGISLDEYYQILQDTNSCRLLSIEETGIDAEASYNDKLLDDLLGDEFQEHLAEAVSRLPERERMLMALYYDKGMNLKEIGQILGVSESRVSQILSHTHLRLRARLQEWL
ncbi:MAG: RNA polymerase sigma factor FliA [Gammaproteobacteria bacterium]|nr:RNA polymerase sigma factor FliA [Gammaproteobacteria bacterium]